MAMTIAATMQTTITSCIQTQKGDTDGEGRG
jgi:hypothetical protein